MPTLQEIQRLRLLQDMRGNSVAPDANSGLPGGNIRHVLLDQLLGGGALGQQMPQPATPSIDANAAAPVQASGGNAAIDAQLAPLIAEAGKVPVAPKQSRGETAIQGLAQAFSVAFSHDPATALQQQLVNQKNALLHTQAKTEAAGQRALGLKVEGAKLKIANTEKQSDLLTKQDEETKRYLQQYTGQEKLQNLRFDQEKKLFDLGTTVDAAKARTNQAFQQSLVELSKGDAREAERLTKQYELMANGIPAEKAREATLRIYFSDKVNPATGKPYGPANQSDGALIAQAHARAQQEKLKLSGHENGFDMEKVLPQLFMAGYKENDTKPVLVPVMQAGPPGPDGKPTTVPAIDPSTGQPQMKISVDPFSQRPNLIPTTTEERVNAAQAGVTAFTTYMAGRGKPVGNKAATAAAPKPVTKEQKLNEVSQTDPAGVLRAKGASIVKQQIASGGTKAEILAALNAPGIDPNLLDGARAELENVK